MSNYQDRAGYALYRGADADLKTADGWRDFIAGGRSKTERKIANNTTVRLIDGGVAIKLHSTDIIVIHDNGNFTLNSGGWRTVTTKERINRFTPAALWQDKSVWYIGGHAWQRSDANNSLFYDGMTINAEGKPLNPRKPDAYERKLKVIKKQAKEYARGYVEALKNGLVAMPSGGDCWFCSMFASAGINNNDHLKEHIKERYYVPSLLVNAGREAGYRDDQIGMMGIGGHRLFIEPERVIYRYMVKHLQGGL